MYLVQSKDSISDSFSTFNGDFGPLNISSQLKPCPIRKFITIKNTNSDGSLYGLNYDFYIYSYEIIGTYRDNFSIHRNGKNYGQLLKLKNPLAIKPGQFISYDLELQFAQGKIFNYCENFNIPAKLKIKYRYSDGSDNSIILDINGFLTKNNENTINITIVSMSNELLGAQRSINDYRYNNIKLFSYPTSLIGTDNLINEIKLKENHAQYSHNLLQNGTFYKIDRGPKCVDLISSFQAQDNLHNFEMTSSIERSNFEIPKQNNFFSSRMESVISLESDSDWYKLESTCNDKYDHENKQSWLNDNLSGILNTLNPHWHSDKWPNISPPFLSRNRTQDEKEGYRHNKIMITNHPTDNYPYSTSGEFINYNSPPNAWGFLSNTESDYKIYHNMATGWAQDPSSSNTSNSIYINDRHGSWFDSGNRDNLGVTDPKYHGININSNRKWSTFFNDQSELSISELCEVTYPNEINSVALDKSLTIEQKDHQLTFKAIPSGKTACENEFGSSQLYKIFDFYYGLNNRLYNQGIYGDSASRPTPWLPFATIPPYIRTKVPEHKNVNLYRSGSNYSPDIITGSFNYVDTDGNNKKINWETNFAHAFVPLKENSELPNHFYNPRVEDPGVHPTNLAQDGTLDQQTLIVHTNLALLHIYTTK